VKSSRSAVRNLESGQATAEYALLLALVAAGLLVALLLFRTSIGASYGRVANRVRNPEGRQETGTMPVGAGAENVTPAGGPPDRAGSGAGGGYGQPGESGKSQGCGGGDGCGGGKGH